MLKGEKTRLCHLKIKCSFFSEMRITFKLKRFHILGSMLIDPHEI